MAIEEGLYGSALDGLVASAIGATGTQWRDLPERLGPWKTVYERHRLWSGDGTWERLLQQVQDAADAAGEIDWDISVDSSASPGAST